MITFKFEYMEDLNNILDNVVSFKGTKDAPRRKQIIAALDAVQDEVRHDYVADQANAIKAGDPKAAVEALHGIQRSTAKTQAGSWAGNVAVNAIRESYTPLAAGNHDALAAEFNKAAEPFELLKKAGLTADPSTIGRQIAESDEQTRRALVDSFDAEKRLTELAGIITGNYMLGDSFPTADGAFHLDAKNVWAILLPVFLPMRYLSPVQRREAWITWKQFGETWNYEFDPSMWRKLTNMFAAPHVDAFKDLEPCNHDQPSNDRDTDKEHSKVIHD